MDNINAAVSDVDNHASMSFSIHSEGFDLDESLAAAEEACRRFAAAKCFVSHLPMLGARDNPDHNYTDDDVCSICMEGFHHHKSAEGNKRLPCGHVYHATCIAAWLSRSTSCPFCRSHMSLK